MAFPSAGRADVSLGIRGGATIDPDLFAFGGHVAIDNFPGLGGLRFEPGVEIGAGDDIFMIRFLGHGKYMFDIARAPIRPFPLLGVEISYFNFDAGPGDGDTTEVGLNLGGGVEFFGKMAIELYFGVEDVADINVFFLYDF
jgi:hypothetical protein